MANNILNSKVIDYIQFPHMTEKSSIAAESLNKYYFRVDVRANKHMVKAFIQSYYNVEVDAINTMVRKGETKNFKGKSYNKSDYKIAIVTLKSGHKINFVQV